MRNLVLGAGAVVIGVVILTTTLSGQKGNDWWGVLVGPILPAVGMVLIGIMLLINGIATLGYVS